MSQELAKSSIFKVYLFSDCKISKKQVRRKIIYCFFECRANGMSNYSINMQKIPSTKCYYLTICKMVPVNRKSHQRPFFLPSLDACSARINMQKIQRFVILHFQNVGMATDEQLWRTGSELTNNTSVITPRITTDVFH